MSMGRALNAVHTMPCLNWYSSLAHNRNHHIKSSRSICNWTKLLLLILSLQLSFKAMSYALNPPVLQSLPMQLPQPSPRRKKLHRDIHAVSRLPSFNSFCLFVSPYFNCVSSRNEPKPSLFPAEHVCGFFGIWDRCR
jgi:hypothetical protein